MVLAGILFMHFCDFSAIPRMVLQHDFYLKEELNKLVKITRKQTAHDNILFILILSYLCQVHLTSVP